MVPPALEENMIKTRLILAAALALAAMATASAQTYPNRPITMIVPFAAGGPTDVVGRLVGQRMGEILRTQIIIENVGGAGGMTGSQRVAQAAPDGYTIVLGTVGTHAMNQTLYKPPLYHAAIDFTPVVLIAEVPTVVIVRKDLPVANLKEFADYAKKNEEKMSYGSAGTGSAAHLACVVLDVAWAPM
jgi:tripartite-type tricarboxylate transporter receptor subunit TctC